jgi:membrane protease YdiL (CAAX protease family)
LITALSFGGVHVTNFFTEGPGAFAQALVVSTIGLYLYVVRLVSGGLLLPILLHAGWDFSSFSSDLGIDPDTYTLGTVAVLTTVALGLIVLVQRHKIWPKDQEEAQAEA